MQKNSPAPPFPEPVVADRRDPLDVVAWRKLLALLGDAKVYQLLSMLTAKLETVVSGTAIASTDRTELSRTAHTAVSSAGVLGFADFAKLCTDLEAACATDADLSDLRSRVLEERRLVLARVAELTLRPNETSVARSHQTDDWANRGNGLV